MGRRGRVRHARGHDGGRQRVPDPRARREGRATRPGDDEMGNTLGRHWPPAPKAVETVDRHRWWTDGNRLIEVIRPAAASGVCFEDAATEVQETVDIAAFLRRF